MLMRHLEDRGRLTPTDINAEHLYRSPTGRLCRLSRARGVGEPGTSRRQLVFEFLYLDRPVKGSEGFMLSAHNVRLLQRVEGAYATAR